MAKQVIQLNNKYTQKHKKRNRNKKSKFFKLLMSSVREAVEIKKGNIEPARITILNKE